MGAINFVSQICVKQMNANLALKWSFFCWKGWLLWSKRLKCRCRCYSCSCSCMNEFHLKLNYHFHTLFRVNLIKAFLSKNVICRHFCLLSLSLSFFLFPKLKSSFAFLTANCQRLNDMLSRESNQHQPCNWNLSRIGARFPWDVEQIPLGTEAVCPDWAIFENYHQLIFFWSNQNITWLLCYFENITF